MNDLRTQFDDAIGAAPPTSIDLDRLVTRQRKISFARRWGAGGGAAAMLGIAVVGALLFTSPGVGPSLLPGAGEEQTPTTNRLEKALKSSVQRELPDATFLRDMSGARLEPFTFDAQGLGLYRSNFDIKDAAGRGEFIFEIGNGILDTPTTCDGEHEGGFPLAEHEVSCEESRGPRGEKVVAIAYAESEPAKHDPDAFKAHYVYVTKPNGTRISMEVRNLSVNPEDDAGAPEPTASEPPMTLNQMAKVALNPDLTVAPSGASSDGADAPAYDKEVAERLETTLRTSIKRELPGVEFTPADNGQGDPFRVGRDGQASYQASFDTSDSEGTGNVMAVVSPPGQSSAPTNCDDVNQSGLAKHTVSCGVGAGENGETFVVVTADDREQDTDDPNRIKSHMVFVTGKDGATVAIWAMNLDTSDPEAEPKHDEYEPTAPRPPLSTDEMLKVAKDLRQAFHD
ncbi:MAG: hypothetical protein ACRDTQ_18995 [Micromonosporaceae bacterium]